MKKPIQISIPIPCHENWQQMTPADKGRFCASCQKKVFDFTNLSDREIATVLKNTTNSCGRFRVNQLGRDLIVPKEKSSLWIAASAAVVSFLSIGTNQALSQTPVNTEQHQTNNEDIIGKVALPQARIITGIVYDSNRIVIPGVNILNKKTGIKTQSNLDGLFSIEAKKGDMLEVSFLSMIGQEIIIRDHSNLEVTLIDDKCNDCCVTVGAIASITKRTFFGRIFHSVGSIFR